MAGDVSIDASGVLHAAFDVVDALAGDGFSHRAVHAPSGPIVGGVVERIDGRLHGRSVRS